MNIKKNREFVRFHEELGVSVPIVNMRSIVERNDKKTKLLSKELRQVCEESGFFYVENHGVSNVLLHLVDQAVREFFMLPFHEKNEIHIAKSPYHRGYVPSGEENAYGSEIKDLKEVFDMALELSPDDEDVMAGKFFHGPNAWPKSLPHFKPLMLWLYREWQMLCEKISELFAISLDIPSGFFVERSQKPLAQLRAAKYPKQPNADTGGAIGCGAHTDYGIVSLIWQMDVAGLEICDMNERWILAPKIPGTFMCPLGDAMGIWTNDHWRPTPHRVINNSDAMRHSLAFFYDQDFDCIMEPLPQFVSDVRPSRYKPTSMGVHVARGFNGTFEYRRDLKSGGKTA